MMMVEELFNLEGKVAVVTGGAGHLGKAISEVLAEAGATVCIASRNKAKCETFALELAERTGSITKGLELDISSMNSVASCFKMAEEEFGKIDILINNAYFCPANDLEKMSEDDWLKGIDGTLNGVFRCTKVVAKIMEAKGSGSIINISSMYGMISPDPRIYGKSGFNNPPNYGAGKAGIIQFTKYCACQLASKGIRVNVISPGPFPNPEVQKHQIFIDELWDKTPLGRIGQPHELKGVVLLLASDASSYITGANIPVDGGWTSW